MDDVGGTGRDGAQLASSRVLLVEDDDFEIISFHRCIGKRELPIELQRARNAPEAFEMLRLQQAEGRRENMLIVLDLNMPSVSGLEFLTELRADPELRNSVVIAFTSSSDPVDIRRAYEHNVAAYITKEVAEDSTSKLVDFIECYLRTVTLPLRGAESSLA